MEKKTRKSKNGSAFMKTKHRLQKNSSKLTKIQIIGYPVLPTLPDIIYAVLDGWREKVSLND